jgi:capsular exopolysaccharide synthesis family protein
MNDTSRLQLERYLQLMNRRKWVVVIPIVLAVLAAGLVSTLTPPTYHATSTLRVDLSSQQDPALQNEAAADRYINTWASIVRADAFLQPAIDELALDTTTRQLRTRVSSVHEPSTELIRIRVAAGSADEAAAIANKLSDQMTNPLFVLQFIPDTVGEIQQEIDAAQARLADEFAVLNNLRETDASQAQIDAQEAIVEAVQLNLQSLGERRANATVSRQQQAEGFVLVERGTPPESATSPRWAFNLAAGLLAGLLAGVALALVLEYVDPTLRDVRDLESVTRLPVLASIPFGIRWKYPPPPISPDYRLLATKLQTNIHDQGRKSILFTSSREEEGCTTVATYSAMALAQAGLRVLLLDANLSRPDLHRLFNLPLTPGLYSFISTNGARPHAPLPEAADQIIQTSPLRGLSVLTAGTKMSDASEVLASPEMREFVHFVESKWDAVIIDGSSMKSGAGSAVLAPVVDAVVLVAAEGQASSSSVEETVSELTSLGANSLGLVYCKATEA